MPFRKPFAFGLVLTALLVACSKEPVAEKKSTPFDRRYNDYARFVAGLPPEKGSPLAARATSAFWTSYAKELEADWGQVRRQRLEKIETWTRAEFPQAGVVDRHVFYPFSGPDVLNMMTFFPRSDTYLMMGLEHIGVLPDLASMNDMNLARYLGTVQHSLRDIFQRSFFITMHMFDDLQQGKADGALPLLSLFLGRKGHRIINVYDLTLDRQGTPTRVPFGNAPRYQAVRLSEIVFDSPADPRERSLVFVRANLENKTFGPEVSLQNYLKKQPVCNGYLKSASYLFHDSAFSILREILLDRCRAILQDDSGVPLRFFDRARWNLQPYGVYVRPIRSFSPYLAQADLGELYRTGPVRALPFSLGYHWQTGTQNLLLATRRD